MNELEKEITADIRRSFDLKYLQLGSAFMALVGILTVVVFGGSLLQYGPKTANEQLVSTKVESIGYGFSESTMSPEIPRDAEGRECFLKLEDYPKTLELPVLSCGFEVGQNIDILVNGDSARLDPRHLSSTVFALQLYVILAGALAFGGIFGFFVFSWRRKVLESEGKESHGIQL